MFTGLIEATGVLRRRAGRPVARAFIEAKLGQLVLGESINVNGACLTVDRIMEGGFEADLSSETLARTTLGELKLGSRVHLERAMPLGGRMGGHVVLGHVDGVGRVHAREAIGDATRFAVRAPADLARFLAPKGSIALDGVSLTLNAVGSIEGGHVVFDVMLVPHTVDKTVLRDLAPGSPLNLEVDVLARYVARQLELGPLQAGPGASAAGQSSGASPRPASPSSGSPSPASQEPQEGTTSHADQDERLLAKLRASGYV